MNWFYESAGQQQGPVPEHELDRLLADGKITRETLVWREGMADWEPLRMARPGAGVPPPLPHSHPEGGEIPPGHVRCALTGKVIPESEAIFIQGKPYSPEAKPQVLHSLQASGHLPTIDDENRTGPAWEKRAELGMMTAAWETIKGVLTEPSSTFSNMRRTGGLGGPLTFYLLVGSLAMVLLQLCISAASILGVLPTDNPALADLPTTPLEVIVNIIFIPLQIILLTFIQSGIAHVSLMICGGANRPFEATFRTLCYVGGAVSSLVFIPIGTWVLAGIFGATTDWAGAGFSGFRFGLFIVIICALTLESIGLARVHEISTGRAALAVLLPIFVCCTLLFVGAVMFGIFIGQATALPQ